MTHIFHYGTRLLFFACLAGLPAGLKGQTLVDALQTGLNTSPMVAKAEAEASVAFEKLKEVKSERRPQITFDATGGAAFRDRSIDGVQTGTGDTLLSRDARLTIQQIVFDFGASKSLVESADLQSQFYALLIEDSREGQALEIAETYLDLYRLRMKSKALRSHISALSELRDRAEQVEDAEGETPALVLEGRIVMNRARLAEYDARIQALGNRFKLLTTMEPNAAMALNKVPRTLKDSVDVYRSPRVRAAELAIQSSEWNVEAAKKDMLPKLFFEGRGGLGENVLGIEGSDDEWAALAVVRWTPYSGGVKKAVVERHRAELAADLAAKEEVIRSVVDSVQLAQSLLNGAVERQRQSQMGLVELRKALGNYEESLDAGGDGVSILSVANTRNEALTSEMESYDALIDSYVAAVQGLEAAGGLLSYFGISVD